MKSYIIAQNFVIQSHLTVILLAPCEKRTDFYNNKFLTILNGIYLNISCYQKIKVFKKFCVERKLIHGPLVSHLIFEFHLFFIHLIIIYIYEKSNYF